MISFYEVNRHNGVCKILHCIYFSELIIVYFLHLPNVTPNLKKTNQKEDQTTHENHHKRKRNTIIMLLLSAAIGIFSPLLMYITLARKSEVYKYHCRKAFNFHLLIFLLFNISSRISDVLFWIVFAFEVVQVIIIAWKVIRDEPYRYFIRIPLFKEDKYTVEGE